MREALLLLALAAPVAAAERELLIRSDAGAPIGVCELGATLNLPANARAVVVMVHGSGTHDRDEAVGAFAPFRDIAGGLAADGIGSLRYDKRGFDPACLDAVAGTGLRPEHYLRDIETVFARAKAEAPGLPVFLLGHSEGVTFTLELVAQRRVAPEGVILLAGLGRHDLAETLMRQLGEGAERLRSRLARTDLPVAERPGAEEALARLERHISDGATFFARLREGTAGLEDRYLGAYSTYWREEIEMTARAEETAARAGVPSLLLQGTEDGNVTREDFEALERALAGPDGNAALIPGANHFFTQAGDIRVDPAALRAITDWLERRVPARPGKTTFQAPTLLGRAGAAVVWEGL